MITLVVFLGNPGAQYAGNRHNVPWQLAGFLPWLRGASWASKFRGQFAKAAPPLPAAAPPEVPPRSVYFLCPETYMNLSGESVAAAAHFYRIPPAEILVVHDELELPFGTVALKWSGGLGGHNGLRSLEANFGTRDFWRLRLGVGRPTHPDVAAYVLSDFSPEERPRLDSLFSLADQILTEALHRDPVVKKASIPAAPSAAL